MYDIQNFGKRLRALRHKRGLSQEHLAFYAGKCVKEISSLECGKGNPTLLSILDLAEALGAQPYELFWEEEDHEQND